MSISDSIIRDVEKAIDTPLTPHPRQLSQEVVDQVALESGLEKVEHRRSEWKSCCLTIDRHAAMFFTQSITLIGVIVLGGCLLAFKQNSKEESTTYISMISLCIGILIPNPKM